MGQTTGEQISQGRPWDDLLLAELGLGGCGLPLASAFEHAPTGMALLDADGRFRAVNPAFARLLGRPVSDVLGCTPGDVTHPDDASTSSEVVASMLGGGSVAHQTEKRYMRPDGSPVPAFRTTTALRDGDGRLVGFFTQAVDMTETKTQQEALARSDRRHRALVRHAAEVIVLLDRSGTITYASPAAERLLGYSPSELEGTGGFSWVHPADRPHVEHLFIRHQRTPGVAPPLGMRIVHADGSWRHAEVVATNLLADPEMQSMVVNVRDLTERHEWEASLQRRAAQQEAVAALGAAALRGLDVAALVDRAVAAVGQVLDVERCAVVRSEPDGKLLAIGRYGPPIFEGLYPSERDGRPASLAAAAIANDRPVAVPAVAGDGDGPSVIAPGPAPDEVIPEHLRRRGVLAGAAVPISGRNGPFGALSVYSLRPDPLPSGGVTFLEGVANVLAGAIERQRAEEELQHRAMHDGLTGLPNRDRLVSWLEAALHRPGSEPLAVMFVDIDDFKVVNDSLGHATGDDVVQAVADRVATTVGGDGSVARFGGDEFLVLCTDTGSTGARRVAERICEAMTAPVRCRGREVVITVSIGIAVGHRGETGVDDLLARADIAMYAAKRAGKDRAALFDEGMRTQVTDWLDMTSDLRRAVGGNELQVHYQPIVLTRSGALFGAEALLRWDHPREGLIGPHRFIGFAEESGLIVPIGEWVLEQACTQAVAWAAAGRPAMVSVNISPRQLAEPPVVERVAEVLARTGVDPAQVTLEVTETAVMSDLARAEAVIRRLRALGVRVGLDDFGTGHSSLSHLATLPLDFVKIDQSFIARVAHDRRAAALLETIGRLCHDLDLLAVAEGIETEEQLRRVRAIGITYSQGYLFGRAVPPEAFGAAARHAS